MLSLTPAKDPGQPLHILCLGAHSDDIEIGCGATICKLLSTYSQVSVTWIVLSANGIRGAEAESAAKSFLERAAESEIKIETFRDGYFPEHYGDVKDFFESNLKSLNPDIIFTHYRSDRHQDHRIVSDLTWQTFRDHLILEYEIPKYDGDLGQPNLYVEVSKKECQKKIDVICGSFVSQQKKHWFSDDTFWALLRLRGVECSSSSRFAEAFHARKVVLE